jgi:hypothetical protein
MRRFLWPFVGYSGTRVRRRVRLSRQIAQNTRLLRMGWQLMGWVAQFKRSQDIAWREQARCAGK